MKKQLIYRFLILGVVPLFLASCFAAKDYERPEAIVNDLNYRTDNLPADSSNVSLISWQDLFTDPLLKTHIEEGLAQNIDIRVAMQQILAAQAYFKQGKQGYFPTLSVSPQYTHQELSSNSQFGSQFSTLDVYQLAGNLTWEADIWGKIRSNERAFAASYLQTVEAHKAVKTQLIANIASAYFQLLALDEQLAVTERTIETRSSSLETTRALKEAGNVTEVGVKQTEAQLYTAQALRLDILNQIRLQENSLSILLGKEPGPIARTKLSEQEIKTPLKTGVPAELLSNRPDIRASEYNLMNAFELTNVARSSFYPSLTLTASGGFQSLNFDKLFDSSSLFATIIGGLTQPIFNGRQIRTQYEVSQANQEEAKLNFRNALLNATREVSDALYSYEIATEKLGVKKNEYEAYELATSYSEELLDNGLVNYLEVLTARQNALNSSLDLVDTRFNQLQAIVDLYEALGGGWE
ncbi:efflux transporter outer membrane subunit [Leeuwenhoekiella aequorea]|uniref:NodT family efflux transporter outer membrane factor (OMF) lipoprotein n=1 Tax=Leeuwenhoekiella aequorea TaxID=283736 RepID=A0A4V1KRA4_9FLAO|nr:efflux transporter outer membrane subunit [Leeuwenhoekiella aequorea]AOE07463.1 membrane protein [uncultured bacterium]AOE11473.1 RND efflux system, outer membrane lipoprotein CmeC [uncultured bacterium]RXG24222.1 NodT family efflux transporter outer membrane factor (OMF) lipoprotein [Leeuwenhoekiella aequorea]